MPAPVVWSEPSYMLPTDSGQLVALPDGSLMKIWDSNEGIHRQL